MENQNTTQGGIQTFLFVILIFGLIFCMLKCNEKTYQLDSKEINLRQSIDSSRIEFEKLKIVQEKLQLDLDIANKELLIAHNNSQISETKLYNLQKKSKQPIYVPEIKPCNDSLQSLYNFSVKKDSACNSVISNKNIELNKKDTIINIQNKEKTVLTNSVKNQEFDNKKLNDIVEIKDKLYIQEKKKRTFWEWIAYSGYVLAGYLAIRR